jgi:outer membrane protein assembly factor BamB
MPDDLVPDGSGDERTTAAWPTPQGVAARTGYAGGAAPVAEPKKPPWTADALPEQAPAVAYGAVFTATRENTVVAYDIEDGTELWEADVEGNLGAGVSVAHGRVYVGTRAGLVCGLDAETGAVEWTYELSGSGFVESNAVPTVTDGSVYVGARTGEVVVLDAETGAEEWTFETEDAVESAPVAHDGWVYAGDDSGTFYALNPEYGVAEWTFEEVLGDFEVPPVAADGTVFVVCGDDLFALDAETGEQRWENRDFHRASPAVADGTVYAATDEGLRALDAGTGEQEWLLETGERVQSAPAVADETVYVGCDDATVLAVDADSGEVLWVYGTDERVQAGPVVADGAVFVPDTSFGENLLALTEGADPIAAEATVAGRRDLRAAEPTHTEDDTTDEAATEPTPADAADARDTATTDAGADEDDDGYGGEHFETAVEQVADPSEPTDEELQTVILGLVCDRFESEGREPRLGSEGIADAVTAALPGASDGLVRHNIDRLGSQGTIGHEDKNRYVLVRGRPASIAIYEERTDERVVERTALMEVLEPLHEQARHNPDAPAMTREELQAETYLDDDELDRIVWYLDNVGKWVEDVLPFADAGYLDTRAVGTGAFWQDAALTEGGKQLYDELS